jgi:hypothetical protein
LLLEGAPLTCEVERVNPQAPPWQAVLVRVFLQLPNASRIRSSHTGTFSQGSRASYSNAT